MKVKYRVFTVVIVPILCLAAGWSGFVLGNNEFPEFFHNSTEHFISTYSEPDPDHYFPVQSSRANRKFQTVNGIKFSLIADKTSYRPGEEITIKYKLENITKALVSFQFSLDCPYDLIVTRSSKMDTVSWYLKDHPCPLQPCEIHLGANEVKTMSFPPVKMPSGNEPLLVQAGMRGYKYSNLSMAIQPQGKSGSSGLRKTAVRKSIPKPAISFSQKEQVLSLELARGQKLSISAYIVNGQKVNQLSREKYFPSGTHRFSFKNARIGEGVLIVKIAGDGFSETKIINLLK